MTPANNYGVKPRSLCNVRLMKNAAYTVPTYRDTPVLNFENEITVTNQAVDVRTYWVTDMRKHSNP